MNKREEIINKIEDTICNIICQNTIKTMEQNQLATLNEQKQVYEARNNALLAELETLKQECENNNLTVQEINQTLIELQTKYEKIKNEESLETYWNTKRPYRNITHPAREGIRMDLRAFLGFDHSIYYPSTGTNDEKARLCHNYVARKITYTSDVKENWQFAYETMNRLKGDCFAEYEQIYTKEGLKRIDEIKVGDKVLSYDFEAKGYIYKPVLKHWAKGDLEINRVHFRNGQHIDVSEKHPMWARTTQKESQYEKQYLNEIDLTRWWKRKVPIAKKIPYTKSKPRFNKEIYLVIGHYIAEGWSENNKISSSGYELVEEIIPILETNNIPFSEYTNNSGVPCIRFKESSFKTYLKHLKRNSFDITLYEELINLPEEYLEQLLYGMWLGDGTKKQYPDKRGYANNKEWTYSTSSKQLAQDIQQIGLHLGRTFHIWKQDEHQGVGNKPIYRINYNPNSHFMKEYGYDYISEVSISYIEKLGKVPMYDITVADTHTVILKNGIITHQCEDGAILMAVMMLNSGIPYWRIRLNAGNVWDGKGDKPTNLNTSMPSTLPWYSQKEINYGTMRTALIQELRKVKESELLLNLKKVQSLPIKELASLELAYANMDGKLLKIVKELAKIVEPQIDYISTTLTKTEQIINKQTYEFYVILAIQDYMQKKGILVSSKKGNPLGTKETSGTGGHAYITYLKEEDNQWYILDWCYWYSESKDFAKKWDVAKKYFGIWFSVNQKYCYGQQPTDKQIQNV